VAAMASDGAGLWSSYSGGLVNSPGTRASLARDQTAAAVQARLALVLGAVCRAGLRGALGPHERGAGGVVFWRARARPRVPSAPRSDCPSSPRQPPHTRAQCARARARAASKPLIARPRPPPRPHPNAGRSGQPPRRVPRHRDRPEPGLKRGLARRVRRLGVMRRWGLGEPARPGSVLSFRAFRGCKRLNSITSGRRARTRHSST
jgi:hypothetical protein